MRAIYRSIVETMRTRDNDTGFMVSASALLISRARFDLWDVSMEQIALATCLRILKMLRTRNRLHGRVTYVWSSYHPDGVVGGLQ